MSSVSPWQAWLLAIRLRTLPVALAPVVVGTAVAFSAGQARFLPALAAGLGALGLQVVSNLANDLFDFESGADGEDRIGPAALPFNTYLCGNPSRCLLWKLGFELVSPKKPIRACVLNSNKT